MTSSYQVLPAGDAAGAVDRPIEDRNRSDRYDTAGWGLLFLLLGAVFLPAGTGTYAAVTLIGLLMLALNAARLATGVAIRWFSVILGATAVLSGAGALAGVRIDALALFFAATGVALLVAAAVTPRRRAAE
jgi:hypothetical protein